MKYFIFIPIVAFLSLLLLAILLNVPEQIKKVFDTSQDEQVKPEMRELAKTAWEAIMGMVFGIIILILFIGCSLGLYYL